MNLRLVRLGECCEVVSGATPKTNVDEYWGGSIPWATPKDVSKNRSAVLSETSDTLTEKGFRSCSTRLIPAGSILVSSRAPIGLVAIAGREMCTNQGFKSLVPGEGVDSRFLYHVMRNSVVRLAALGNGATFKEVSKSVVERFEIPLPPLSEQTQIAMIIDKADSLRGKREYAIRLSDDFLRATFIEIFGDPVTNPKGWDDTVHLESVAEVVSGITKGRKLGEVATREVPYLAVSNVQDRYLNLKVVKTIAATEAEIERYRLRKNDLLLTEGGDPDKLGRGCLWAGEIDECIHQNHVFRVRLTSPLLLPTYLSWLVGSKRGKQYFLAAAKQTTGIASINMRQLKSFPLLIPPLDLQQQFVSIVERVAAMVERQHASLRDIELAARSLGSKFFSV